MVKQRQNNRIIEKRINNENKYLCLVPICNKIAKFNKRGTQQNYCEDHSFFDMQKYTSFSCLRLEVFRRDNYKCVKCGKQPTRLIRKGYKIHYNKIIKEEYMEEWKDTMLTIVDTLIADHIIPIALGGDEWDINNLQTLCPECNKIKTKEDIKNIAELRKIEKKQNNTEILNKWHL